MSGEDDASDGVAISADQFAQLMGAINASQARMDESFTEFWTEVRQGQEDAAAKSLKRARYEEPYACAKATRTRRRSTPSWTRRSPRLKQSSQELDRLQLPLFSVGRTGGGRRLLTERQKLLRSPIAPQNTAGVQ